MTIIDRKRTLDFIKTFLAQYEQGGLLPVWELSSNETECMIGYHSVSVIADAAVKGINGFDMEKAFEAMKKSAEARNRYGLGAYMDKGMIETDDDGENVSRTLEYAYDDWCIAQMALLLKKDSDYKLYMERSQYWKNLFDPVSGFIRPRKNGGWYEPFDPREVNNNYTEANAWQYTFFVPHEVGSLSSMIGNATQFEKKLDELFSTDSKTTGREQSDISGLIGQYAHGNEPSHHMAYLYNYIDKPEKTFQRVHQILNDFYHDKPDGLIGNEDCGQMSAWYVLSALGLYQVCPGSYNFEFSVPLFPKSVIHLENGKTFSQVLDKLPNEIASGNYFQSYTQQAQKQFGMVMSYGKLMDGGSYSFKLKKPSKSEDVSFSRSNIKASESFSIQRNPIIEANKLSFRDSLLITIKDSDAKIFYTVDNSTPNTKSVKYVTGEQLSIDKSTTIKAIAVNEDGLTSKVVTAQLNKMPHPDWKIKIISPYDNQYTAGGDEALIDGLRGDVNWRKGYWQGYEGKDFECIIDLGKEQSVGSFTAEFLQDVGAWIFMPKKVEFSFSKDGNTYSDNTALGNNVSDKDEKVQKKTFKTMLLRPVTARFVKVKAINYGKLPEWHPGAGGDSWLFLDEITIN